MRVTALTGTPAFLASSADARFWSSRVIANQRSAGTFGRVRSGDQAVGVARVGDRQDPDRRPAAPLIALPCPVKIGLLARIRSARD